MSTEKKEYRIVHPVKDEDGEIIKSGTVKLTDKAAKRFLAMPQPPILDPEAAAAARAEKTADTAIKLRDAMVALQDGATPQADAVLPTDPEPQADAQTPADPEPQADEQTPAAPEPQPETKKPITEARIVEAIGQLEPGNDAHWTKGQKPEVKALEAILGGDISAAERDAAFAVFQESKKQQ